MFLSSFLLTFLSTVEVGASFFVMISSSGLGEFSLEESPAVKTKSYEPSCFNQLIWIRNDKYQKTALLQELTTILARSIGKHVRNFLVDQYTTTWHTKTAHTIESTATMLNKRFPKNSAKDIHNLVEIRETSYRRRIPTSQSQVLQMDTT